MLTKIEKILKDFKFMFLALENIIKSCIIMYVLPAEYVWVIFLFCIEIFYSNLYMESEILKYKAEDRSGYIVVTAGKHL